MKPASKETFLSALRHALTAIGSFLVARGYLSQSEAVQIGGAVLALVGFIWGPLDEYLAARRIEDEARIAAAVAAALANYRPNGSVPVTGQTNQPAQ